VKKLNYALFFIYLTFCLVSADEILGHNGIHYELVKGWGEANLEKVHIKNCQGMVTDSRGRLILLTDDSRNNVIIILPDGSLVDHWTLNLKQVHGLSVFKEKSGREVLFITDNGGNKDAVYKTTLKGEVLLKLGYPEKSGRYTSHRQYKPSAVLNAPNGDFYVLDGYGLNYIVHYNSKGEYLGIFGGTIGEGEAHLKKWGPHGGAVDLRDLANPMLLIACSDQQYLKRFTLKGEYIDKIEMPGANPRDIFIHDHRLFIPHLGSDWPKQRNAPGYVSILDAENRVVSNIGGTLPEYEQHHLHKMSHHGDTFIHPHALTLDHEGNLYVAQWASKSTWPLKFKPTPKE
jgi:hypothetical protein